MADETFSYSAKIAQAAVQGGEHAVQSGGFFVDWVFNAFAGAIDIQVHSPILTLIYVGMLIGLVILRLFINNPVRMLGCAIIYIYTLIQTYALYKASSFVVDFTEDG